MKTNGKRVCQVCGTALNEKSEFCPVCALLRAGGQESAPSEAPNPVFDSERNSAETEPASTVRRFENYEVMLDRDGKPIELGGVRGRSAVADEGAGAQGQADAGLA